MDLGSHAASPAATPAASPADWVDAAADVDDRAPALVFADGAVTYGQLADQVHRRARSLGGEWPGGAGGEGTVVAVAVRLDLASIVEILALQSVGLVPLPFVHPVGDHPHARVPGAVVAVATSGTSGARRLVPLTMANLTASVVASRRRLRTGRGDRWLLCLPIDHIGGLAVLFRSFEAGGAVVVSPFGVELVDLIDRTRPTVASLVPTMLHRLLDWDADGVADIPTVLVGGGRLPPPLAARAESEGVAILTTYGSTETSSQVATMAPGEGIRNPGYVGAPLDGFTVTIETADTSGAGLVAVDGPAVFGGHPGSPRRGPHVSNDVGRIAADGSLTILGRSDDVVVTGGLNVSLTEVADAIDGIEGVVSSVVVGLPDDEWGTAIAAVVDTEVTIDQVRSDLAGVLAPHQIPRRWRIGAIPLLPNGKPDLAGVRRSFLDN